MLDIDDAILATTTITPGKLSLGDSVTPAAAQGRRGWGDDDDDNDPSPTLTIANTSPRTIDVRPLPRPRARRRGPRHPDRASRERSGDGRLQPARQPRDVGDRARVRAGEGRGQHHPQRGALRGRALRRLSRVHARRRRSAAAGPLRRLQGRLPGDPRDHARPRAASRGWPARPASRSTRPRTSDRSTPSRRRERRSPWPRRRSPRTRAGPVTRNGADRPFVLDALEPAGAPDPPRGLQRAPAHEPRRGVRPGLRRPQRVRKPAHPAVGARDRAAAGRHDAGWGTTGSGCPTASTTSVMTVEKALAERGTPKETWTSPTFRIDRAQ